MLGAWHIYFQMFLNIRNMQMFHRLCAKPASIPPPSLRVPSNLSPASIPPFQSLQDDNDPLSPRVPDAAPDSIESSGQVIDLDDYHQLEKMHLEERARISSELPGGMRLRSQRRCARIDECKALEKIE